MQVLRADAQTAYRPEAAKPHSRHGFLRDLTHDIKQDLRHGLEFHLAAARAGLRALAGAL